MSGIFSTIDHILIKVREESPLISVIFEWRNTNHSNDLNILIRIFSFKYVYFAYIANPYFSECIIRFKNNVDCDRNVTFTLKYV